MEKNDNDGGSDLGWNIAIAAIVVFGTLAFCERSSAKAEARRKAEEKIRAENYLLAVSKSKSIKHRIYHRDPTEASYGDEVYPRGRPSHEYGGPFNGG